MVANKKIKESSIQAQKPDTFQRSKTVKLLARITQLTTEEIPADPPHERWNQGNTLGKGYRHWKRAKFGSDRRYRLFFRYDAKTKDGGRGKAIVYAWMNDEETLRKEGDKNDPYAVFARGLVGGEPPDSFEERFSLKRSMSPCLNPRTILELKR